MFSAQVLWYIPKKLTTLSDGQYLQIVALFFSTDTFIYRVFEPLNCAMACPANTYTKDEWVEMKRVCLYIFAATLVGSTLVFVYQFHYFWSKPLAFVRLMFIFGFCSTSLLMVTFLSLNGISENNLTCEGDYAAIEDSPFCQFQAAMTVFLAIWTQVWSFFMALECYLYVSSAANGSMQAGRYNAIYFVLALIISGVCAGVPLIVGNFGFDIEATAPFCFFLVSDTTDYLFAACVYPFTAFAGGCILLTCATIHKIQKTFVLSDRYTYDGNTPNARETEIGIISTGQSESQIRMSCDRFISDMTESPLYNNSSMTATFSNPFPYQMRNTTGGEPSSSGEMTTAPANIRSSNSLWHHFKRLAQRTWQYSGRQLIFVVTFVMATAFIVPSLIYVFGGKREEFVRGTEEFAACLFLASVQYSTMVGPAATQEGADAYSQEKCGKYPQTRVSMSLVSAML